MLPFVSGMSYQTMTSLPRAAAVCARIGSADSVISLWIGRAILSETSCCASFVASQLTNLVAASCASGVAVVLTV